MIGYGNQKIGIGEAIRGRLGAGDLGRVDAKVAQILAVQALLDRNSSESRLGKGLHRLSVGSLGRRTRKRTRKLSEIERVLDDVGLKTVARERTGSKLSIERERVNRLAQPCRALPDVIGKMHHRCRILAVVGVALDLVNEFQPRPLPAQRWSATIWRLAKVRRSDCSRMM